MGSLRVTWPSKQQLWPAVAVLLFCGLLWHDVCVVVDSKIGVMWTPTAISRPQHKR